MVAVLAALIALVFLMACGEDYDAEANATATAQAATETIQALTPTATPTLTQQITAIVKNHHPDDGDTDLFGTITGTMRSGGSYRVDVTEPENLTAGLERVEVQQDTYSIFDALYASNLKPDQVTVRTFGSCTDKYGNSSTCQWSVAVLTKQTEKLFNWKGLEYESAWADYDQAEYLVSGF